MFLEKNTSVDNQHLFIAIDRPSITICLENHYLILSTFLSIQCIFLTIYWIWRNIDTLQDFFFGHFKRVLLDFQICD